MKKAARECNKNEKEDDRICIARTDCVLQQGQNVFFWLMFPLIFLLLLFLKEEAASDLSCSCWAETENMHELAEILIKATMQAR